MYHLLLNKIARKLYLENFRFSEGQLYNPGSNFELSKTQIVSLFNLIDINAIFEFPYSLPMGAVGEGGAGWHRGRLAHT
jgi:hypothetical protein